MESPITEKMVLLIYENYVMMGQQIVIAELVEQLTLRMVVVLDVLPQYVEMEIYSNQILEVN
jgi:hypothetical protein